MHFKVVMYAAASAVLGLALTGCGGGGGGDSSGADAGDGGSDKVSSLVVSGTAATGAAIASGSVVVKCKTGTATATTDSAGAYTVSMEGGALPCIVQVSGTGPGGVAVTLHSVVEAGTDSTGNIAAVANVTPVTEMIVAQLLAKLPADAFATFDAAAVTPDALATSTSAIVDALKAAGFDLGTTDPLKGALVPPGGTATQNAYDALLDQLGAQVPAEALPLVVNGIATAAAADTPSGLATAMASVAGGALEACPLAISGKYRTIDYIGSNAVWDIDFKKGTFSRTDGSIEYAITTDAATPCVFHAGGTTPDGRTVEWQIVQGKGGFGTYRARTTAPTPTNGVTGWMFPVQAHQASALQGEWRFLHSGSSRESSASAYTWEHVLGQATVGADLKMAVCDYDANLHCVADTSAQLSLAARSDGGFDLNEADAPQAAAVLYGYRSPTGTLTVFGTTNPAGDFAANSRVSLVFTKVSPIALPAVGFVSKYAESITTATNGLYATGGLNVDSYEVTAVDTAAGTFARRRGSDQRADVFQNNKPLEGMRLRDQIEGQTVPPVWQFIVSEAAAVSINASASSGHFYSIAVNRP